MIICVVTERDEATWDAALASHRRHPQVFGRCYAAFDRDIPRLGQNEDLFIISHGAAADRRGNPVIGDRGKHLSLNAVELWQHIEHLVPAGYSGNVYISACESADVAADFSFAEVFKAQIEGHRSKVKHVFGQKGAVEGEIPLPRSGQWREA